MEKVNTIVEAFGEAIALPIGRTVAKINDFDIDQRERVVRCHQIRCVLRDRAFGVKTYGATVGAIKIFEESNNGNARINLFDKGQLTPPNMSYNDVGRETIIAQLTSGLCSSKSSACRVFPSSNQAIGFFFGNVMRFVNNGAHTFKNRWFFTLS